MYHYRRVTQRLPKDFTFGAYVEMLGNKRTRQRYFRYRGYRLGAADYLLDEKDQLLVKHVIYFEHRERDVALVREKLKLPNLGTLKIQKARPEGQHYTDQYTPHTREIISQVYARDIACFGYHFGD